MKKIQVMLTPAAGKQLIAMGLAAHPRVQRALQGARLIITAGTGNSYVAAHILKRLGDDAGFDPRGFFRGITRPAGVKNSGVPSIDDIVIEGGKWKRDLIAHEIAPDLTNADVILKGANAVDLFTGEAGVLIGNPKGGTVTWVIPAVIGRRVGLICPVGVEKRVAEPIHSLCDLAGEADAEGLRLCALPGAPAFTELDAIELLSGAKATLLAGGGVAGAEGAAYFYVEGDDVQIETAQAVLSAVKDQAPFVC